MILKTYEWDEKCKSINTNHLITLCETLEDYKSFCDDLELLIKSKSNIDLVSQAYKVMRGDFSIHSQKYKSFIEKHKSTIEIMKKNSCLYNLTCLSYDVKGKRNEKLPEDYFYEYIVANKKDVEIIKELAIKLKKLGFDEIKYGETLDFKDYEYDLTFSYGSNFGFLENVEVIPSYLNDSIKYKTNNSNYCMHLSSDGYGDKKEISKYNRKIYLNSLVIDSNRLPNEITTESTIGVIKKLADDKKQEYCDIRGTVEFGIATLDLNNEFEHLKSVADRIDIIKNKEELINILSQMEDIMLKLQSFDETFEKEIVNSNTGITLEKIENEKKLYLHRRYMANIDID